MLYGRTEVKKAKIVSGHDDHAELAVKTSRTAFMPVF
jgi:hypothetical protein